MPNMDDRETLICCLEIRIGRIEGEILKLKKQVQEGIHDPRSVVGDVVLVVEGQLKQMREIIEDNK